MRKLPMIVFAVIGLLIAGAVIARVTGLWPMTTTRGRPQQSVP